MNVTRLLLALWGILTAAIGLVIAAQPDATTSGPSLLAYTSIHANQDVMITWPGKVAPSVLVSGPYDASAAAWSPACLRDCRIAYTVARPGAVPPVRELFTVRPNGTGRTNLTPPLAELVSLVWSPDGRTLAADFRTGSSTEIYLFRTGEPPRNLTDNPAYDFGPVWSPDGQQIAFRSFRGGEPNNQGELFVATLDAALHVVDLRQITGGETDDQLAGWSPDGQWILFTSAWRLELPGANPDVFIARADGSLTRQLTTDPAPDTDPVWSPDGQWILYETLYGSDLDLFTVHPDGSGLTNVSDDPRRDANAVWSPDGQWIAYQDERDPTSNLMLVRPDGSERHALTTDLAADINPVWSPDGQWIAFESLRSGNRDIFVVYPDGSGLIQITTYPGVDSSPAWSPPVTHATDRVLLVIAGGILLVVVLTLVPGRKHAMMQ